MYSTLASSVPGRHDGTRCGSTGCHVAKRGSRDARAPITRSSWTCRRLDGGAAPGKFVETDAGTLWVISDHGGVQRLDDAGWSTIPGSLALPSRSLAWARPSPRGARPALPGAVQRRGRRERR